jgi:predicted NAD-dependent protein-ADP-ribosyltransferase YbiA (DUF1768 family)
MKTALKQTRGGGVGKRQQSVKRQSVGQSSGKQHDTFQFYSKSSDEKPGRGAGETLVSDPGVYAALASVPDWRKVLSNFHVCPFKYDGKTYRTIEHAFQASKIQLVDPGAAALFATESGSQLSRGDGGDAQKQRKMRLLPPAEIARWNQISGDVMARIAQAKYAQCPQARAVLLATGDAVLMHSVMRSKPVRFTHLEDIRAFYRAAHRI